MTRLLIGFAIVLVLGATAPGSAAPAKGAKPAAVATSATTGEVDSLALAERAVARDSSNFDNLFQLGTMYIDHERMLEAITVFTKAATLQPGNVEVLVNLGMATDAAGHPDQAQAWYQKALDVAPSDSMAACKMATSKYSQGKYDEAMTLFRAIITRQPRAYCAYFQIGVGFADAGIYRDAIRMWRKVIEIAPDSAEAQGAKESIDVLEKFLNSEK